MASALFSAEDRNRLVFEAVNESSVSKFKFVHKTFSQIEVLTSLIQCNEKDETPLEIAMKGENVSLIDELVIFLRKCDREVAKCHVMSEAIDKLFYRQIPILELIDYLINIFFGYSSFEMVKKSEWSDIIAQVVLKSTSLSRPDKIIALELIGASLHDYYEDNSFNVIFRCWREAMTLRYLPADDEPLLPKVLYVGVPSVASSVVYGTAVEVMSMEELDLLEEDFERNVVDLDVEVRRQSLLMIRRICRQGNHGHPHWLYFKSLYEFGMDKIRDCNDYVADSIVRYSVMNRIVINTFLLILEEMAGFDPELLPLQSFNIFIKSLAFASYWLGFLAMKPPGYRGREELFSYTNLLALTKFVGTIAKFFPNPAMMYAIKFDGRDYIEFEELISMMGKMMNSSFDEHYNGFAKIICDLVFVLEYISPQLYKQEEQQIGEHLSHYIRNYFLERTTSVLHAAVVGLLKSGGNLKPIKLMIKLGADPDAMDKNGETPLHWLAKFVYSDEYLPVFQALVNAGAHLDMAADDGNTVLDILKDNLKYKDREVAAHAYISSLINTVFPLSCYCARVIRRHGIQFDEDRLPLKLQEFVSRH